MSDTIRRRQHFFIVENAALDIIRTAGQTAFCVYCTLLGYANQEGVCFPLLSTLARDLDVSKRTIQTALAALRAKSLLEVEHRPGYGSIYTVKDPSDSDPCNQLHGGGATSFTTPVQPASPPLTYIEQDSREQDPTNKTTTPPPTPQGGCGGTENGFDEFWAVYPRHVSKTKALTAWRRLKPDEALLTQILAALVWQRMLPDWRKEEGRFVPHPATYLNQRRWEDERPRGTTMEERIAERASRLQGIFDRLNSRPNAICAALEGAS